MTTVRNLLDQKGHEVLTMNSGETVYKAIREMSERNVGSMVVTDDENKPVGLFTERDYARNVFLQGKSSTTTTIGDIIDQQVVCARPEQTVEECMAVMTDKRVRHLPVIDDGKLVGIISIGDLVKSTIADQQFTIEQLELYIRS
ncbi:MAG: CBS domain-containing protein [Rhodospirillales bacterium]|nr:CBS domain-containing protein [Rhodospirillales bacterium]